MRERILIFIGLIILAVSFTTAAHSQDQIISQSAFEAGLRRHSRQPAEWQGKARRMTRIVSSNTGVLREVSEYDTSGSSRRVWEGTSNGQPIKQQAITVGLISYNKMGDAKWTWKERDAGRPAHIAPFESDGKAPPFKVAYEAGAEFEYRVGAGLHKEIDVLIYTRIKRTKSRAGEVRPEALNVTITTKYWLAPDGRVVKFEQWDNHRTERSESTSYISSEWELDPKILIRAPLIDP